MKSGQLKRRSSKTKIQRSMLNSVIIKQERSSHLIGINMSASSRRTRSRTSSRKKVAPAVKGETASPMKRRRRANNAEEYDDNNMSDNETVYLDAVEEMDWEYIADENKEPEAKSKNSARSNQVIKRPWRKMQDQVWAATRRRAAAKIA